MAQDSDTDFTEVYQYLKRALEGYNQESQWWFSPHYGMIVAQPQAIVTSWYFPPPYIISLRLVMHEMHEWHEFLGQQKNRKKKEKKNLLPSCRSFNGPQSTPPLCLVVCSACSYIMNHEWSIQVRQSSHDRVEPWNDSHRIAQRRTAFRPRPIIFLRGKNRARIGITENY